MAGERFDSLTDVRFRQATQSDTVQIYDEAAFLYTQILANPQTEWGDLQYALWALFDPAVFSEPGYTTTGTTPSSYWLALAQSQTYTPNQFSGLAIYTPLNVESGPQEFIGGAATPEPSTGLMLSIGLGALLLGRRQLRDSGLRALKGCRVRA